MQSLHIPGGVQLLLDLEGVTKKYGPLTALQGVSFHVEKNETVGLLGRNGAGKTTLLNLITGYLPPTAGKIRIGGKDLEEDPAACKRMIGYLPERPPLYDEMTVTGYLRFVCELREVKKQAIRPHVEEILALCGLTEVADRLLGHLSRGYRQRAGIAQALCGAPELLILDEPTVGLDPKQTVEIRELIRALSHEHTVIFSSHILSEVQQACSRVLILDEGRLVTDYDAQRPQSDVITLRLSVAGEEKAVLNRLRRLEPFTGVTVIPGSGILSGISAGNSPETPFAVSAGNSPETPSAVSAGNSPETPSAVSAGNSPETPSAVSAGNSPETSSGAVATSGPEGRHAEPATAEFRVTLPRSGDTGAALDRAFRALAESGLPVRMMREEREDLEAVFLRAISRS